MDREIILSVIIPVYNGGKYLGRMIEMLEKQTFQKFEVLFVDDGSTDETYKICRRYEQRIPYIRVVRQKNQGVSHARNTGIQAAKGEWIQFIDVDDVIHENMFTVFNSYLEDIETELAVCGCIRKDAQTKKAVFCGPEKSEYAQGSDIIRLFEKMEMDKRYWLLDYIWNKWYKKEIIEQCNIRFPEKLSLGEDFVFNTQYFQHISSLVLISEFCYEYEVHADGLASSFQKQPWEGRKLLYINHKKLYQSLGIWETEFSGIRLQYGQIYWGDIRRINSKNCHLSSRQRKEFVKKMVASEMFDMISDYLATQKGIIYRIYRIILKSKNIFAIYCTIRLEKILTHYFKNVVEKNVVLLNFPS